MSDTNFSIAPLDNGNVDSTQVHGGAGAPAEPPVVDTPIGNIVATETVPYSRDVSGNFSDPNGEALTFTATGLPAGLSISTAGVISGTPTTQGVTNYAIRATNESALWVEDTGDFIIQAAPVSDAPAVNWPNVQCAMNGSDWLSVYDTFPSSQYMRSMELCIRQPTSKYSSAGRAVVKDVIQRWFDNRIRDGALLDHINSNTGFTYDPQAGTGQFQSRYDKMFLDSFDFAMRDGAGNPLNRQTAVINADNYRWCMNHANPDYRDWWSTNEYNMFNDLGGPNNIMFAKPGLAHDGVPDVLHKRFCKVQHSGAGVGKPTSKEYTISAWPSPPTTGSPDGQGYFSLTDTYSLIVVKKTGGVESDSDSSQIVGYKDVGGGNGQVLVKKALPSWANGTDEDFYIYQPRGNDYSADWNDDGSNENRFDDDAGGQLRRDAYLDMFDRFNALTLANYGYDNGYSFINCAGSGQQRKQNPSRLKYPNEFTGKWEAPQSENAMYNVLEFIAGSDPAVPSYDASTVKVDKFMEFMYYERTLVKRTAPWPLGTKGLGITLETRQVGYENLNQVDAAAARFCMAHCHANEFMVPVILITHPQAVFPWKIAESVLYPGNDPADRNVGDIVVNSFGATPWTYTWRPADFGQRGYVTQFLNYWVLVNYRTPTDNPGQWIPHHLPAGQAIVESEDVWTVSGLPAGKVLRAFNEGDYVNPATGEQAHTGFWANTFMGTDTILNNGGGPDVQGVAWDTSGANMWKNGDQIACGALEGRFLMIEDE